MSESYIEVMVERKPSGVMLFLKYLLMGLAAVAFLGAFVFGNLLIIIAIAFGVGSYFVGMYANIEYEYLYLDKEITIDKVMNKSKRKRVGVYQVDKMEILAPLKSYHLDSYRNRQVKELYRSGAKRKEIAEATGLSEMYVRNLITKIRKEVWQEDEG